MLERARSDAQRELADSKAAHDRAVAEGRREGREIERAARAEAQEFLRAAREEAAAATELGKELRETVRGISRRFREADSLLAQELDAAAREISRHGTLDAARLRRQANAQPAQPQPSEGDAAVADEEPRGPDSGAGAVATRGRYARPPGR